MKLIKMLILTFEYVHGDVSNFVINRHVLRFQQLQTKTLGGGGVSRMLASQKTFHFNGVLNDKDFLLTIFTSIYGMES